MPLINLKTKFKSLKYGNDMLGGGSSGQPYIQVPIPEEDKPNILSTGGSDFLLRGGVLAPIRAATDVARLSKMFFDFKSPNGPLFIAKQNLLSRTNVKTEASKGPGYAGGVVNQGLYLPTSTIAQAGLGFAGAHLNLLGMDPTGLSILGIKDYFDVISTQKQRNTPNRLVELTKNTDPVNILEYGGGPGSVLGIGKTKIKYDDQRTGKNNPNAKTGKFLGSDELTSIITPEDFSPLGEIGPDFRKKKISKNNLKKSTTLSISPGYNSSKALDGRVNQGSPGTVTDVLKYSIPANGSKPLDKITAMPMYEAEYADNSKAINDLVKFRIASINNDGGGKSAVYMHFRAFIDSFSDNYNATWNQVQYVGRGDSLGNYGGFTRDISMGFTVFAQSKAELIPMYKKLNHLASTLTPDYTSAGFMRGNLVRLTMGGYIYEQPGYFTSLNYTIPQESPWEIGIDENGDEDSSVKELPHMIQVTLSFTPIHNFLPQIAKTLSDLNSDNSDEQYNNPKERYIALADGDADKYSNYKDSYLPPIAPGDYVSNTGEDITDSSNETSDNQISLIP